MATDALPLLQVPPGTAFASVVACPVQPVPEHAGQLTGLLGDFDGDPDNDVRPAGGEPVADLRVRHSALKGIEF